MDRLTGAQRELVALGAALGSNCVPCVEYHGPQARSAGLGDRQIEEAIHLADTIRQVPARKVLDAALRMLSTAGEGSDAVQAGSDFTQPASEIGKEQPCCG